MKDAGQIRGGKPPAFKIILVSGIALLWVLAATLQYRWAKELSEATQGSAGENLQTRMTQWHRDLYDELSTICIALQVGPDSGKHDDWNDYLQRYVEWKRDETSTATESKAPVRLGLVKNIYEWETSGAEKPRLLRLNPTEKTLDQVSLPADMEKMLGRLEERSSDVEAALNAWAYRNVEQSARGAAADSGSRPHSNALAGWQLDDRVPALVHPVVHHTDPFHSQSPVDRKKVDWLVVALDLGVIQNQILPELTQRYFAGPPGLEYKVAVVDTDSSPRMIYSSEPHLKLEDVAEFDSMMNIFGPVSTMRNSAFWQRLKDSRTLQVQDWRNFAAPGWFPVFQYGTADEPWVLVLQHRTQPVSEIAGSIRRRNLLTGGVVLVLLAANIGLIVFESHRAEKLATAQMEFVASTSHELLTPLSAIYCSGQNAKDGLLHTKEDVEAHGAIVTGQARQVIDLIKQNLSFAASSSDVERFTLRPLEVRDLLQQVQQNMAIVAEQGECNVRYEAETGLPCVVGDRTGLAQCVQNLVGNAIKYSGKNGQVLVNASLQEGKKGGKEVQISVTDDGPGIEGADLRHIFEPFYRSPKVVRAQIHGTGLGLTVATRIAEAMGGKLSVTSKVGAGSTFTLHLPAVAGPAATDQNAKKADVRK